MFRHVLHTFDDRSADLRGRLIGLYALLIAANVGVWAWALSIFREQPILLGSALLAYSFGLRHAVDADHIAAIDNVTRKLMQDGKRPMGIGFWFSMGHSAVVVLVAAAIALTTAAMSSRFQAWKGVGGIVSTSVSTLFLFAVAAMNVVILIEVWRTFHAVRRGGAFANQDFDTLLNSRGFLARLFRPLFRLVTRSWHMLPLGFLFGLGFDTATEVALLGMSATQAGKGMSIWSIMVFPALFAAGMSLIDTTDGVLMLGAYNWAFIKPMRKLYYNLVITAVSVVVAVLIGGIEGLGLISGQLGLQGRFWNGIGLLNDNFNNLGFAIIGVFIGAWVLSLLIYRYTGLDDIEVVPAKPR
ncbi:HoxN/HupN/NixA family nickel/cobalt transporter [Rhodopila globiformis]|uniref:Nickel/cobalt efflux system n=1 Tax=Rhodopila globiformis TaxID=1071 RepID=A0A2S6MV03_RHOGL|nr:HoxN/HupN/NixA family nickel/cobalt transporter [Rhodopila globiformis]PPQ26196.1 HoxN/HupN/NixA family nickel/cobalt transporter [Rhodopila globiformis]